MTVVGAVRATSVVDCQQVIDRSSPLGSGVITLEQRAGLGTPVQRIAGVSREAMHRGIRERRDRDGLSTRPTRST